MNSRNSIIENSRKKRGVIVIGSAWNSCGSYELFKSIVDAYQVQGIDAYFLATPSTGHISFMANRFWKYYRKMTTDMKASARGEAKLSGKLLFRTNTYSRIQWAFLKTPIAWRTLLADFAEIPNSLIEFVNSHDITHIHNNHYFNLPMAQKICARFGRIKIVSETQDIQSYHLFESNWYRPFLWNKPTFANCLAEEIKASESADEMIHLNETEFHFFNREMPDKRHHLIFPGMHKPAKLLKIKKDIDFLIVASANEPNYNSLCWFLDNVWNSDLDRRAVLRIAGNVDWMFRAAKDPRLKLYKKNFMGRIADLNEVYHRSKTILAPVSQGHGIAIKTIEALSYGIPFIYTPMALRGFENQPIAKKMNRSCATPLEFRAAIESRLLEITLQKDQAETVAETIVFEKLFSFEAYTRKIADLVDPII
jgi:polysaccharide biosynthesis protein PslH